MKNEFTLAFNEVLEEKGLPQEVILTALENAMASAYRKAVNASTAQEVQAKVDLETGKVTYWSRSRQAFWVKGETSGHLQELAEMRVDCDRDCLLVLVRQTGPACHTNRRSCFYSAIRDGAEVEIMAPEAG